MLLGWRWLQKFPSIKSGDTDFATYSVFVGVATMLVMMIIPALIVKLSHSVQVEKMKKVMPSASLLYAPGTHLRRTE